MNIKYVLMVGVLLCGCEKQFVYDENICIHNSKNKLTFTENSKTEIKWIDNERLNYFLQCKSDNFKQAREPFDHCMKRIESTHFENNKQLNNIVNYCNNLNIKIDYMQILNLCSSETDKNITPIDNEEFYCKKLKNKCEEYWKTEDNQIKNGTYKGSIDTYCNSERKQLFQ